MEILQFAEVPQKMTHTVSSSVICFQLEKAFDAYTRNNITMDWYPIPQYDDCINDPPGNCAEGFP